MNYLDIFIIIIFAIFTIRGFFRGLITELMTLISLILGFFIAITYLNTGAQLIIKLFPSIPEFAANISAFVFIFLIVNIIIRLICKALNKFATFTFLQPINHFAGALFALGKTAFIISIVFVIIEFIPYSEILRGYLGTQESYLYPPIKNFAPAVYKIIILLLPGNENFQEHFLHTINKADSTAKQFVKP